MRQRTYKDVFCCPSIPGHGAYPEEWLISSVRLFWSKLTLHLLVAVKRASEARMRVCAHFFQLWDPIWRRREQALCVMPQLRPATPLWDSQERESENGTKREENNWGRKENGHELPAESHMHSLLAPPSFWSVRITQVAPLLASSQIVTWQLESKREGEGRASRTFHCLYFPPKYIMRPFTAISTLIFSVILKSW